MSAVLLGVYTELGIGATYTYLFYSQFVGSAPRLSQLGSNMSTTVHQVAMRVHHMPARS